VADRIGIYVDAVFNNIANHNGSSLLFASLLHPFQVYGDFGGYSLIAIGSAKVLGYKVMTNFNRPFFAISMSELWRRWHISLIQWFTDYIYTPLAFSFRKVGIAGVVTALLITFLITGIWHGSNLTFITWGVIHGILLSIEAITNRKRASVEKKYGLKKNTFYIIFNILLTYVLFAAVLVFTRAESIGDAFLVYRRIFTVTGPLFMDKTTLVYLFIGLSVLLFKDTKDEFLPGRLQFSENKSIIVRYMSYGFMIFMILLIGVLNGGQFIYFQF
jgi:D-alanyl-lipoteichoic acid acyltransferase DltB (MBOAT superfamily)